jgi:hypothetical protein
MSVPESMTLTYLSANPGVDMAALVAAETCSLPYTGFVPLHYTNELGSFGIPARFHHALTETSITESSERTERNIAAADGILTIYLTPAAGDEGDGKEGVSTGTQHGLEHAIALGKRKEQLLFVTLPREGPITDLEVPSRSQDDAEVARVVDWIVRTGVTRCAIGGPRESEAPGIQTISFAFLCKVFEALQARKRDEMK